MSKHSSRGSLGAGPVKERVWGERGMKSRRMLCCLCCWGDAESIDHVILRGLWPSTRWPDMLCICRVFLYASWNYTCMWIHQLTAYGSGRHSLARPGRSRYQVMLSMWQRGAEKSFPCMFNQTMKRALRQLWVFLSFWDVVSRVARAHIVVIDFMRPCQTSTVVGRSCAPKHGRPHAIMKSAPCTFVFLGFPRFVSYDLYSKVQCSIKHTWVTPGCNRPCLSSMFIGAFFPAM